MIMADRTIRNTTTLDSSILSYLNSTFRDSKEIRVKDVVTVLYHEFPLRGRTLYTKFREWVRKAIETRYMDGKTLSKECSPVFGAASDGL